MDISDAIFLRSYRTSRPVTQVHEKSYQSQTGQFVIEVDLCKCVLLEEQMNLVDWLGVSYSYDQAEINSRTNFFCMAMPWKHVQWDVREA